MLRPASKARKLKLGARRLRYEADEARRGVKPEEKIAVSARELATKLSATLAETRQSPEATGLLVELHKEAEEQQRVASDREKEAVKARSRSENLEADAENAQAAFDFSVTNSPVLDVAQRWIELSAAFLVLTLVPLLTFGDARDVGTLRVAVLVVRTEKFTAPGLRAKLAPVTSQLRKSILCAGG